MILESTRSGHRLSYSAYFSGVRDDPDAAFLADIGRAPAFWRGLRAQRLLMSTADDYLIFATCLGILRILILRRSLLVTIRAEHALDRSGTKAFVRRALYRLLRDLPLIQIFSIMPHEIEQDLARLTNDSISDPAFFELPEVDENERKRNVASLVPGQLPSHVVFLGCLSEARNIGTFLDLFHLRTDIIAEVRGRRARNLPDQALANTGQVAVTEGHLSASDFEYELIKAHSVWCAFRPEYDNFSGVFCNAVCLGTPVWVTKGSRLCRFSKLHGGQEIYRLSDEKGQIYVLYQNISLNLASLQQKNDAALK